MTNRYKIITLILPSTLLFIVMTVLFGCDRGALHTVDDGISYKIYSDFLEATFIDPNLKALVIVERTAFFEVSTDRERDKTLEYIRSQLPNLEKSTFKDFVTKNASPMKLESKIISRKRIIFISEEESNKLFGSGGGWNEFYKRYPNSQGRLTLSRIGISKSKKQALFYYSNQSYWKAGAGFVVLLRDNGDRWIIENKLRIWIS